MSLCPILAAAGGLWLAAAAHLARRRDAPATARVAWALLLVVLPVAGPAIYLAGGRRWLGCTDPPANRRSPRLDDG
jgi:hypothetical protein